MDVFVGDIGAEMRSERGAIFRIVLINEAKSQQTQRKISDRSIKDLKIGKNTYFALANLVDRFCLK